MCDFFIVSLSPFFIASFAYHPSNPNPDLSHQMPRYFYFSAALISIPLAQIFVSNIQNNKFLIVFLFILFFQECFL